jgi:hypothetical protein
VTHCECPIASPTQNGQMEGPGGIDKGVQMTWNEIWIPWWSLHSCWSPGSNEMRPLRSMTIGFCSHLLIASNEWGEIELGNRHKRSSPTLNALFNMSGWLNNGISSDLMSVSWLQRVSNANYTHAENRRQCHRMQPLKSAVYTRAAFSRGALFESTASVLPPSHREDVSASIGHRLVSLLRPKHRARWARRCRHQFAAIAQNVNLKLSLLSMSRFDVSISLLCKQFIFII